MRSAGMNIQRTAGCPVCVCLLIPRLPCTCFAADSDDDEPGPDKQQQPQDQEQQTAAGQVAAGTPAEHPSASNSQQLDALAAAAEAVAADAQPRPLLASVGSLEPSVQAIVRAGHEDWLPTKQVLELLSSYENLPLVRQQPARPQSACMRGAPCLCRGCCRTAVVFGAALCALARSAVCTCQ